MQEHLTYTAGAALNARVSDIVSDQALDYSYYLDNFGFIYRRTGYHLQVGEIKRTQGWILHISVIRPQISAALEVVLPVLRTANIPFKVVQDIETARNVLDGNVGNSQVGKVISIYPESDIQAEELSKKLIEVTRSFKGPAILTDAHLGGCIYTRYGSFEPVIVYDNNGNEVKHIYDHKSQLIKDEYYIPFRMPVGIQWPFKTFPEPHSVQKKKKILNYAYWVTENLKSDARGDVMKALYVHRFFDIRYCVIKQGKNHMCSDELERDITHRLAWQKELHDRLARVIDLPKIYDFFIENGDSYLVMQYIKGPSLYERLALINKDCRLWANWDVKDRLSILDYLIQMVAIIDKFHLSGYVHRDITPVNFLVDNNNKLALIDIELAYDLNDNSGYPPFELGTYGFMSPEQISVAQPTEKQDIYSLGATMITLLTGVSSYMFDTLEPSMLIKTLSYFIDNYKIAKLLTDAISVDPEKRPSISHLGQSLEEYKLDIQHQVKKEAYVAKIDASQLQMIIKMGLKGLISSPTLTANGLWLSKTPSKNITPGKPEKEYSKTGGLREGVSGILYLLARAKENGFEIDFCKDWYYRGWEYISSSYLASLSDLPPGLYGGAAGIALALSKGVDAGLLEDNMENMDLIRECFDTTPVGFDIAAGTAGQALSLLQCRKYIEQIEFRDKIQKYKDYTLGGQHKKGYWIRLQNWQGKKSNALSFIQGNTGVTWFLLEYMMQYDDATVMAAAVKSLCNIYPSAKSLQKKIERTGFRIISGDATTWDEVQGVVLLYIKAYELWKDPFYKNTAEEILSLFPDNIIHDNLTQDSGLAGLAEIYLEAYRVFENESWVRRAEMLIYTIMNLYQMGDKESCYWLPNNSNNPTADFLVGNSGIIHLLLRYYNQATGYRLLK